jgi:hypothetical protein
MDGYAAFSFKGVAQHRLVTAVHGSGIGASRQRQQDGLIMPTSRSSHQGRVIARRARINYSSSIKQKAYRGEMALGRCSG